MPSPVDLTDPIAVLLEVVKALRAADIEAAVYGGLALAVYGEPRETKDADLAIVDVAGEDGVSALESAGLSVVLALDRVILGGNRVTRLSLLGGDRATGLNVTDLVEPRSVRFARNAVERALTGTLRDERGSVLTPEDFVLFKILSTRDRDLEDAASVLRSLSNRIELALIEREVERLAVEIPDHDIVARHARLRRMI